MTPESDRFRDAVQHPEGVWRDRADHLLQARFDVNGVEHWEQLWARRVADGLFEICCIPFMAYGMSLGDVVAAQPDEPFVVHEVVRRGDQQTFRLWLSREPNLERAQAIHDEIKRMGCLHEGRGRSLLAISVSRDTATEVRQYLELLESRDGMNWESA